MTVSSIDQQFSLRDGWCKNGSVRLHYVESNWDSPSALTPLIYAHSAFGTADDFIPEMKALSPRSCIGCSLRGRGKSDAPEKGYSFEENVSDLNAIVNHLNLERLCLMGWSIGVTYSIAYTSQHPERVSGLILLDYPARHPKWPAGWAERWLNEPSIRDSPDRVIGLRGLERESREVLLWDALDRITCPILVIGGGAEGSLLKEEDVARYREHCQKLEVVIFPDSGHNVSQPSYDRFIRTINKYLETLS